MSAVSIAELWSEYDPAAGLWRLQAACAGKPPEWWFPQRGACRELELAKALCRRCPVRAECLAYALTEEVRFGVWGGLSERQRRRLRRRSGVAPPAYVAQ